MWFQMSLAAAKSLAPNFAAFAVKISRIKAGGFVFWQPLLCPRQWARLWKTEESVSGFSPPLTTDSTTLEFPDPYLLPPGLALHPVSPAALRPSKHHKLDFSFYRRLAFNIIMNYYHYPVLLAHYCWLDCEADLRLSAASGALHQHPLRADARPQTVHDRCSSPPRSEFMAVIGRLYYSGISSDGVEELLTAGAESVRTASFLTDSKHCLIVLSAFGWMTETSFAKTKLERKIVSPSVEAYHAKVAASQLQICHHCLD